MVKAVQLDNLGIVDIQRVHEAVRDQTLEETAPALLGVVGNGVDHPWEVENQPKSKRTLLFLAKEEKNDQ